jgi:hypothetical protein
MINISVSQLLFLPSNNPIEGVKSAVANLYEMLRVARGPTPDNYFKGKSKILRVKFSCQEWLKSICQTGLSSEQILAAFHLSQTDGKLTTKLRKHFENLTNSSDYTIGEIIAFKTPMRALLIMLWHEGHLLLPIEFDRNGVELMLPTLYNSTDNFFTSIVNKSKNSNLKKYFRYMQYTVDWHSPESVSFSEVWEAIPKIRNLRRHISGHDSTEGILRHYTLLSWLEQFSAYHPECLSIKEFELLRKYVTTIGPSKYGNYDFKTPEDFENYHNKSKKEKDRIQMNAQNARIRKERRSVIYANGTPEENFANITVRNREDFEWLEKDGYLTRELLGTKSISAGWLPFLKSYHQYLLKKKYSKGHRKKLLGPLYKLCDYLFCYIPDWIIDNPDSAIEQPLRIDDFLSVIFWNCIIDPNSEFLGQFGSLPKPLLVLYNENGNQMTSSGFVKAIHAFFEYSITYREQLASAGLYLIDEDYTNPINLKDAPGSGPRPGGTGKMVVPAFSVGVLRHYVIALDRIGQELRSKIFEGKYTSDEINEIAQSQWIDLDKFSSVTLFETSNPKEPSKKIEIPLLTIPNVYSWHWANYRNPKKNGELLYTSVPWLSSLRMIAIGLFAGQRLQGIQWLGLNNYRSKHHEGNSYWTRLYLCTDKTKADHTCRLQRYIMPWLDDEALFQTTICEYAPAPANFDNDENSTNPAQQWLFRSPFGATDTPFSDGVYFDTWIRVLRGLQPIWDSIAPEQLAYRFYHEEQHPHNSKRAGEIKYTSPHKPHALRNSWITWMLEKGKAEPNEVRDQSGHLDVTQTLHYASGPRPTTDRSLEFADLRIEEIEFDINLVEYNSIKPSDPTSVLQKSLRENKSEAMKAQHMLSIENDIIPSRDTGYDLIPVTPIEDFGVFDDCICPFNGRCPRHVLKITKAPRRCGVCPYAIYSLDNLEAISARMRSLERHIKEIREKVASMESAGETELMLREYRVDANLTIMEYAGLEQISEILLAALEQHRTDRNKYLVRDPAIFDKYPIILDRTDVLQEVLSNLLDIANFPAYSNVNYMANLQQQARKIKIQPAPKYEHKPIKVLLAQIASVMKLNHWSIRDLSERLRNSLPLDLKGLK